LTGPSISLAACSESPTEPAAVLDVSGEWRGQIADWRADSRRALALNLEQRGSSVTGSAVSRLWTRVRGGSGATVEGRATSGGRVELTARSIDEDGCFDLGVRMTRTPWCASGPLAPRTAGGRHSTWQPGTRLVASQRTHQCTSGQGL
jgi:hypothetical protein